MSPWLLYNVKYSQFPQLRSVNMCLLTFFPMVFLTHEVTIYERLAKRKEMIYKRKN